MSKPKEYKYKIKKYTKYNGETWYEVEAKYSFFSETILLMCLAQHGTSPFKFPTLEDVQIAIDKHKQEQLEYVENKVMSVENVKLPEPWKNRIDKDMLKRNIDPRSNCESKTQCKWSSDSVCKSNCREGIFKGYQPTEGGFNDLGVPPQNP